MPTVPNLEAPTVEQDALPGRPYPRLDDSVSPAAFGAPLAAGIEDVSSAVAGEDAKQKVQNDNLRIIDANTQLEAGRNALLYGKPDPQTGQMQGGAFSYHGTDAINLPGKMIPAYQHLAGQITSTLTPDQQKIFQSHVASGQNELNLQLNRYEYEESNRLADQVYTSGAQQAIDSASLAWRDPIQLGKSRADIKALVQMQGDREGWAPAERDVQTQKLLGTLHENVIQSMIEGNNAQGAQSYLNDHRGEIAPKEQIQLQSAVKVGEVTQTSNGILAAFSKDANLGGAQLQLLTKSDMPQDQKDAVIQQVERGRNDLAQSKRQDPAIRSQVTSLDDSIASGTVQPGALNQVESLWRQGAYTDDQRASMRDQILRAQKKGDKDREDLAFARDAFDSHTPLDPKDGDSKRAVNRLLEVTTQGQAPGSPGFNNQAAEIAAHVGLVPEGAISYARANLTSGEPEAAASASQLMQSLQRASPKAYVDATDEGTRALAASIGDAVKAGTDPKTAVALARENASRSPQQISMLNDMWNRQRSPGQKWDAIDSNIIRGNLNDDPNYKDSGLHLSNTVPAPPLPMMGEFQSLTKEYFSHTNGNLPQAQQLALNDLKATWGISTVNGSRELMKYAPERMVPGLTSDMVREDLKESGHPDAHLTESANTGTSGGKEWNLSEKDQFGAFDTVRDKDGMPLRYSLPDVKQATEKAAGIQHTKDVANLKQEAHINDVITEVHQQQDNNVGLE